MSPDLIALIILQTIRLGAEALERYQRGQLTAEQLAEALAAMHSNLADANAQWEAAASTPPRT